MTRRPVAGAPATTIALIILVACMAAPSLAAQVVDRVMAVVSGTVLLQSDARAALELGLFEPGAGVDPIEAAMRWLIDRQLVLDEAARGERVDIDPDALGEALDTVRQRFRSEDEYARALAGLGLDGRAVRRLVRDTLTTRLYIERRFDSVPPATEEDLREYYAGHAARFVRNGRQLGFEEALTGVTAALQQERRAQAVSAWLERLRRRAEIQTVYVPAGRR